MILKIGIIRLLSDMKILAYMVTKIKNDTWILSLCIYKTHLICQIKWFSGGIYTNHDAKKLLNCY